jgi:DNA-directed RNA polymerase subunit L
MPSSQIESAKELDLGTIDVSIADALRSMLLNNPEVVFAGVMPPHPLFGRVSIKILTKKKSPESCLMSAAKELKITLNALFDEVSSSLQESSGVS